MAEHARLSASGAARWGRCPGSLAMEEALPLSERNRSSVYADEGTAAHQLAALSLDTGRSCAAVMATTKGYPEWTMDMARDTQIYVDLVREMSLGHTLLVEQRVDYSNAIGAPGSFGTADAVILTGDGRELMIVDLKFGRGVEVSAEENEQLMLYAIGAIETFDMIIDYAALRMIRLVISQPRLHAVSEWECSKADLETFRKEMAKAAKLALSFAGDASSNLILTPGEKQCRWCKAAAACPALAKEVEQAIDVEFDNLDAASSPPLVPESSRLLSKKMSAIAMIESWCKAVRAAVESALMAGQNVPGWKLVEGKRGNRKWTDEMAVEAAMEAFKMTAEDMYDRSLISPAVAEKLLKKSPEQWKKLTEMITRSEGKSSVAPASDSRHALSIVPPEMDFEPIT